MTFSTPRRALSSAPSSNIRLIQDALSKACLMRLETVIEVPVFGFRFSVFLLENYEAVE
jgi:hypothetical protein